MRSDCHIIDGKKMDLKIVQMKKNKQELASSNDNPPHSAATCQQPTISHTESSIPNEPLSIPRTQVSIPRTQVSIPRTQVSIPREQSSISLGVPSIPPEQSSISLGVPSIPRTQTSIPKQQSSERKIFIGGLRPGIDEKHVREHFSQFGKIHDIMIIKHKDGL